MGDILYKYISKTVKKIVKGESTRQKIRKILLYPLKIKTIIENKVFYRKYTDFKYNIAITAIFKNEANYLVEWIEYYKLIGVEHFYLYDNGSDDEGFEILAPYIEKGLVTLHAFPGVCMQVPAYRDAVSRYKKDVKWMMIVDIDEFILLKKHEHIQELLESYEGYDQILCKWLLYGSSGFITKPGNLVIENYLNRSDYGESKLYKSIVKPLKCWNVYNSHESYVVGSTLSIPYDIAQCNHYFCKSYEEFICKKAMRNRGSKGTDNDGIYKYYAGAFHSHDFNSVYDDSMIPYIAKIKENILR